MGLKSRIIAMMNKSRKRSQYGERRDEGGRRTQKDNKVKDDRGEEVGNRTVFKNCAKLLCCKYDYCVSTWMRRRLDRGTFIESHMLDHICDRVENEKLGFRRHSDHDGHSTGRS